MSSSPGLNGWVGRRGLCWIVSMAAGLSAAGGTGPPPAVFAAVGSPAAEASFDASIVGVHLYPEERTLRGENAIQQYLLMGTLSDGSRKDLTAQASFSLSDPNVARPQEGGGSSPSPTVRPKSRPSSGHMKPRPGYGWRTRTGRGRSISHATCSPS